LSYGRKASMPSDLPSADRPARHRQRPRDPRLSRRYLVAPGAVRVKPLCTESRSVSRDHEARHEDRRARPASTCRRASPTRARCLWHTPRGRLR